MPAEDWLIPGMFGGINTPQKRVVEKKRKLRAKVTKKEVAHVSMTSKFVTASGKYEVSYGIGKDFRGANENIKAFKTRKEAVAYKNKLIKQLKNKGYKVEYMYIGD